MAATVSRGWGVGVAIVSAPVATGDGGAPHVFVEVDIAPDVRGSDWKDDEVLAGGAATKVVAATRDMLADSVELARTCAASFSKGLSELPDGVRAPAEVGLEIGITLDAELGAVLAKARGSAQLKVTLTWRTPD